MNLLIPIPYPKTNARIIIVEIIKFIASLVTTDKGKISLGKNTFFIILPFSIIVNDVLLIAAVQNVHGINPQHINTV